jgi:hypothetical protein
MNREAFYQLIDKAVEAPPGTIRGDENLADVIGWDSMAQVTFMTEFDKHFGKPPCAQSLAGALTVEDLVRLSGNGVVN